MIGIDGCKSGWCVVHEVQGKIKVSLISDISELENFRLSNEVVLIDVPIGLPDYNHHRKVEAAARQVIPYRSSSIFGVPCRDAVYAYDYKEANRLNRSELGKGLSIQSWNICPKIKEVDQWLIQSNIDQKKIKESHPELCFHFLQPSQLKLSSKKTKEGRVQRLLILEYWKEGITRTYDFAMNQYLRKQVAADDIIDALCMWLVCCLQQDYKLESLIEDQSDAKGIGMNMHFINPFNKVII